MPRLRAKATDPMDPPVAPPALEKYLLKFAFQFGLHLE
jgi:hypothetical protein